MRTYDVTLAELPEQTTAVVHAQVAHDGIGAFIGSAFGEVMGALGRAGEQPVGMPFARYHLTEEGFDVEAGFPVRRPIDAVGRVKSSNLPGGSVARVIHQGPYDEVAGAYQAAVRWIDENGLVQRDDAWEMYLDEPDVAEPRTEVFVPCRPAHR
jgi:effector-binding domain-containing protein